MGNEPMPNSMKNAKKFKRGYFDSPLWNFTFNIGISCKETVGFYMSLLLFFFCDFHS